MVNWTAPPRENHGAKTDKNAHHFEAAILNLGSKNANRKSAAPARENHGVFQANYQNNFSSVNFF